MKQNKKLYSQAEIAKITGLSKATVSRKIKQLKVAGKLQQSSKLYDETILKLVQKDKKSTKEKTDYLSPLKLLQDQVDQLKEENKTLKKQLEIKDSQITALTALTSQAQQLNALDKNTPDRPINYQKSEPTSRKKRHWWNF